MMIGRWYNPLEPEPNPRILEEALRLRERVFGAAGQADDRDPYSLHVLLYAGGCPEEPKNPVATGRLQVCGARWVINQVCVLPEARGQYYGDTVMRMLLWAAWEHQIGAVYLSCPQALEPFFLRFGFQADASADPVCPSETQLVITQVDAALHSCHGAK